MDILFIEFKDIIDKLNLQKHEFFYNEGCGFARDTFKRIKGLKSAAKQYATGHLTSINRPHYYRQLHRSIRKSITLINELLVDKRLYVINIKPLTEIKERLESLIVMITLTEV